MGQNGIGEYFMLTSYLNEWSRFSIWMQGGYKSMGFSGILFGVWGVAFIQTCKYFFKSGLPRREKSMEDLEWALELVLLSLSIVVFRSESYGVVKVFLNLHCFITFQLKIITFFSFLLCALQTIVFQR